MKRMILPLLLALSACTVAPPTTPGTVAVTPLGNTAIDDRGIRLAFLTFDALLDVVDAFKATGNLTAGTPRALAISDAIIRVKHGLTAASAAQKAGNATSYAAAFSEAQTAILEIRTALKTGA